MRRLIRTHIALFLIFAVIASVAVTSALAQQGKEERDTPRIRARETGTSTVQRKIDGTVREAGVLQPRNLKMLAAPMNGTLLSIAEEGTRVKKGDVLFTMDVSGLRDNLAEMEVLIATSQANKESLKSQMDSLKNQKVLLEKIRAKRKDMHFSKRVAIEQQLANGKINSADQKAALSEIELATLEAQLNVLRQDHELKSGMRMASAQLEAADAMLERSVDQSQRIQKQIQTSGPRADFDGIIVHSKQNTRRTSSNLLEEGSQVRERQEILGVFEEGSLQIDVEVHESRVSDIRKGQSASIQFDAFPDRTFRGNVVSISSTPSPAPFFNPNVKTYTVAVALIDEPNKLKDLRIGLTAVAEIDIR